MVISLENNNIPLMGLSCNPRLFFFYKKRGINNNIIMTIPTFIFICNALLEMLL